MNWLKTLLISLTLLLLPTSGFAQQQPISGTLTIEAQNYYLEEHRTDKKILLRPRTSTAKTSLQKLSDHDQVLGTGEMIDEKTFLLDTVDYVGLKRLLGEWKAQDLQLKFHNFRSMELNSNRHYEYAYTLTPGEGNTWKVFLSNSESVALGNLVVDKTQMWVEFYDTENGTVTAPILLQRVGQ